MKLLHFSPGAIQIAGGIVLFLIGLRIIFRSDEVEQEPEVDPDRKAVELALYPHRYRYSGRPYRHTCLQEHRPASEVYE